MRAETTFVIAPEHPAFAGHFPGAPMVPGVLLLDAALHTALQALRPSASGDADSMMTGCQISAAKFLSPVGPGETLRIVIAPCASGRLRFDMTSGNRKVATGTLVLVPLP